MNFICYLAIFNTLVCLSVSPQDGSDDRLLQQHRQTLENYGVVGDIFGADRFLNSLIPTAETKAEIEVLIRGLSSPTYREREAAEKSLIARGPTALDQLRTAAEQGDTETRSRSLRCIKSIDLTHRQLVSAAIEILKLDPSNQPTAQQRLATTFKLLRRLKRIRKELIDAPRKFVDESCREQLKDGVEDADSDVRIASVLALPECFSKSELEDFVDLMDDDDAKLATVAVETMGFLEPQKATRLLIKNLSHRDQSVRRSSVSILRTISAEYFAFRADASVKSRRKAIQKWKSWMADNSPVSPMLFEKLSAGDSGPPIGFLVSVSNSQVYYFDINGKQVWNQRVALYDAQHINDDEFIVAERNRDLVRVINRNGETQLRIENVDSPSDVEMLDNGNVLALSGAGRLYEFADGKILKTFTGMDSPFDADRLPNGDTIVADSGNNRIVIFDPHGRVSWQLGGLPFPNNVHRLPDGRILYTTYTTGSVVMLSSEGELLWRTNLPGSTLYSVYGTSNEIYVADGGNSKIWILDSGGQPIRDISIPVRFCDVDFVTK